MATWCDASELWGTSQVIKLNGTPVTSQFTYSSLSPIGGCPFRGRSDGYITVPQGPNVVRAEISDSWGNIGVVTWNFTYTPPPSNATPLRLVEVSPDFQLLEVERQQSTSQQFVIRNAGWISATYAITGSCSGSAFAGSCTPSPAQLTLSAGASGTVSMPFTTSATTGSTGTTKVTATDTLSTTVKDSGAVDVRVATLASVGVVVASVNPGTAVERELCLNVAAGSAAAFECADLRVVHALPSIRTLNKPRTPTLHYASNVAHPVVRLAALATLPNDGVIPTTVTATLTVSGVLRTTGSWTGSDWIAGSTRRIALSYDAVADSTGVYPYSLEVRFNYPGNSVPYTATGELIVVNRGTSPFGAGWWLAGLEQLIALGDGRKLWIGGDGTARVYSIAGTDRWAALNVTVPDTLKRDAVTGFFTRVLPNRLRVEFNPAGQHVWTINRLEHKTPFFYDGAGRLEWIGLPPEIVPNSFARYYRFTYDGAGKLASVIADTVGGQARVTTVTVNGSGRVDSIRDPDQSLVSFGYDPAFVNRMWSRTDRRGTVTTYSYGAANTLSRTAFAAAAGDSIITSFFPQEIKGLTGTAAVKASSAYTKLDGPRTSAGDTTLFWLDRFGAPTTIRNALGNETRLTRADPTFLALVTEVHSPGGRVSQATYNSRGNVLTSTQVSPRGDGVNAVTTYTWETAPGWDLVRSITLPEGEVTTHSYDTVVTGNRLWERPGADAARQVTYRYSALGQLVAIQYPGSPAPIDSIIYDATLYNLAATRTPLGVISHTLSDRIGRDTLTRVPVDLAQTQFAERRFQYDAADQVIGETATGGAQTLEVLTHYDAEGNADTIRTRSIPDTAGVGWIVRAFTRDAAHRTTAETLVGYHTLSWTYDPAGNVVNDNGLTLSYDVLGQVAARGGDAFTYDAAGNMLTASNEYARITRSHYPSGAIRTDSSRVSTHDPAELDFTKYVSGLRYGYDLNGRRTWMKYPGADSVAYDYRSGTGELEWVEDAARSRYTYTYDNVGRLIRLAKRSNRADSVYEVRGYDLDSRMTALRLRSANGAVLRQDSLVYDVQGRIIANPLTYDTFGYSALGALTSSHMHEGAATEEFLSDALGHRAWSSNQFPMAETWSIHHPGSSRVLRQRTLRTTPTYHDTTYFWYDDRGNESEVRRVTFAGETACEMCVPVQHWEHRTTLSWYDNANRLIKTRLHLDSLPRPAPPYTDYNAEEHYRYDPLGRRIYARVQRGPNCATKDQSSGCRSTVTRFIWDGSQLVKETRALGDTTQGQFDNLPSDDTHHGTVVYTHGVGIDQPLVVVKGGTVILPRADYRGAFTMGTCPAAQCTSTEAFFAQELAYAYGGMEGYPNGPPRWNGSLTEGQQDASGYQYRRNRYYDPKTGRFTQEDPIGLAGGLNVYGYANGDPVNFSDPFGLKPCPPDNDCGPFLGAGCPAIADHCNVDMSRAGPMAVGALAGAVVGAAVMAGTASTIAAAGATARLAPLAAAASKIPFEGFQRWGKELVGWGDKAAGAIKATGEMTLEKAASLDPAKVRMAKQFYENAVAEGTGGAAAVERVRLMARILELQGKIH